MFSYLYTIELTLSDRIFFSVFDILLIHVLIILIFIILIKDKVNVTLKLG